MCVTENKPILRCDADRSCANFKLDIDTMDIKKLMQLCKNPKDKERFIQFLQLSSEEIRTQLARSILAHYFGIRFTKYISSLIKYATIDYYRVYRKRINRNPLIFDSQLKEDGSMTFGEFLLNVQATPHAFERAHDVHHFQSMISSEKLYYAFQALTDKQKEILTRAYGMEQSDTEIASTLKVTQQAVTKARNAALTRLRKHLGLSNRKEG